MESMLKTRRQPGDRRWGLHVDYPLQDSSGFLVLANRRKLRERRRADTTMEELAALLARARQEDT
jgi:hypothetical protein